MSEGNPIAAALDNPAAAPTMAAVGDPGPDMEHRERPPFPPGSPVRPLGIQSSLDGKQTCYYLDANGQLVGLEAGNRHGKNSLIALFGHRSDWLEAEFPQWSAPKKARNAKGEWEEVEPARIIGFDQAKASRALIEECFRRGIFTAAGKMRGTGAHRCPAGGMVLHCGDKLLASKQRADGSIYDWHWTEPGQIDNFVYPAGEKLPRPWHEPVGPDVGIQLLKILRLWFWKRELLDPVLFLGAMGAGPVGGYLKWRPNIWLTGGRGTGKSTLNGEDGLLHRTYGEGLFRTGNSSAAAIRQTLRNSTVPVMFDEIEASTDNRRVQEVIELARVASSGEKIHRGSQDHQAQEFTLRSCFWFSSINIPPLQPQDRSRLGILELEPIPVGTPDINLDKFPLPELGRKLLRRMVDAVPVLEAVRVAYAAALSARGHDARACSQFSILLACAHVLLHDVELVQGELPADELALQWADACRPERMAEISEATPDHEACMIHLLTSMVQSRGGDERESLGSWIGDAVSQAIEPLDTPDNGRGMRRLQNLGLKLVNANYKPAEFDLRGDQVKAARWGTCEFNKDEPGWLAVAGKHQGLAALFEKTHWQGGVWRQSLARTVLRGDDWDLSAIDGAKVKFGHASLTAVLVPLAAVLEESELPNASRPHDAAEWLREQKKGAGA